MTKLQICGTLMMLSLCCPAATNAAFTAVRLYDENVVQFNRVDVSATAFNAAQMTTAVASAYDAGLGGVIHFDNGVFTSPTTLDVNYAGGDRSLRMTNGVRTWQIGNLGNSPNSGAISGGRVAFNGNPAPFPEPYGNSIIFGDVIGSNSGDVLPERVTAFGLTVLDANFNNAGNDMQFVVNYSDGSMNTTNWFVPLAFQTQDTFFGWQAPMGAYIESISFTATNNLATDDWAFVTSEFAEPVPEPGTAW